MADKLFNKEVIIRDATGDDMSLVAEMAQELANYQNMPTGPKITAKELRRDGFETKWPLFRCKIAEVKTTRIVIGFAVYYFTYSTREGKAMWCQNLFVTESYRQCGVGRMLFRTLVTVAVASECTRLDFRVLAWNPARIFYDKLGARNLTELDGTSLYQLSGDAFKAFVQEAVTM